MFLELFNLRQQPFGVTPDPAYLFPSRTHCEALDALTNGILEGRGFLALIAEPGMGKTTLLYQVLEAMRDKARGAYLFQTQCDSREFFQYLLSELGIDTTGMGLVAMHTKLNEMLFNEMFAGKRFVLIVDEAQNLDDSVLETIRLLSNFETSNTKLLQIVLAGQPQLADKLAQPKLEQLSQRIAVVQRLEPFSPDETARYVRHRVRVGGNHDDEIFEQDALALIAAQSGGVPRNINRICYNALLEAHAQGARIVTPEIVEKANHKLSILATAKPEPAPAAEPAPERPSGPVVSEAAKAAAEAFAPTPLTYKPVSTLRPRGRNFLTAAVAASLLAGAATAPRTVWGELLQSFRGTMTSTFESLAIHRSGGEPLSAIAQPAQAGIVQLPSTDTPATDPVAANQSSGAAVPNTNNIQIPNPQLLAAPSRAVVNDQARPAEASGAPQTLARELGLKINRIAIDPGHGGSDTGAMGPHGLLEKDLCLDVAQRLGRLIQQNIDGAEVIYTRQADAFVPLERRTDIANRANADLFISIHANSSDIRNVRGVETYYLDLSSSPESTQLTTRENALGLAALHDLPDLLQKIARNEKTAESKQLAGEIQDALSARLQLVSRGETNRGVKHAPFIVLTGAKMPAILSEISFVSNAHDESLLQESAQRQRVAEGLYRGIAAYLDTLNSAPFRREKLVSENRQHNSVGGGGVTFRAP